MAAPKRWGYTREKPVGDELLVSWSDGDLTEILVVEVEERALADRSQREELAAWARAAYDSGLSPDRDWIVEPRKGLLESCRNMLD
jgi:hypothetical protein